MRARAVKISGSDPATCSVITASTAYGDGVVFRLSPAVSPPSQTQTSGQYVTWNNISTAWYTLSHTPPTDWVFANACYTKTGGAPYAQRLSAPLGYNETISWDLGYTLGTPWVQTAGGNVYAERTINSPIPALASPRSFALDGEGGSPGAVLSGGDYDFDATPGILGKGESFVSSSDWLAQDSPALRVNWYEWLRIKVGGPVTPSTVAELGSAQDSITKPPSRTTPYYLVGDATTLGDWVVGEGETVILVINGNLTLGGKVTITGSGFVAFIVSGNITVSPSVGGLYSSSTPVIEGIYVTSPTGTFQTGTSSVVGKERLVLQGIFVAGNFTLQRDLDSVGANPTTSSELFLYNPRLLFTMPRAMMDVVIKWEEVAP